MLGSTAGTGPILFGYDANGNITSANVRIYVYDLLNRLVGIQDNGSQTARYTYNADNQRITKTTSSGTRVFHYDPQGHLIAETTSTGQAIADYVYVGDQLIATIRGGAPYYYHNDHLGTPRVLTDASGNIAWNATYTPFGMAQITVSTVENPFRLPGQYYDTETGLHYNWNRYYQPETGRYITPDPIGLAGGINPFGYVGGNPVGWVDREVWPVNLAKRHPRHGPHRRSRLVEKSQNGIRRGTGKAKEMGEYLGMIGHMGLALIEAGVNRMAIGTTKTVAIGGIGTGIFFPAAVMRLHPLSRYPSTFLIFPHRGQSKLPLSSFR